MTTYTVFTRKSGKTTTTTARDFGTREQAQDFANAAIKEGAAYTEICFYSNGGANSNTVFEHWA